MHSDDYNLSKLQYELLETVTAPLDDMHTFMLSVLECFKENVQSSSYLFCQYAQDPLNQGKYVPVNPVNINLPENIYDSTWRNSYYDTCVYNPNTRQQILSSDRQVFTVGDIVTPAEYENSPNYRDLLLPANLYYSFAVILKKDTTPLGYLTLSRPKAMGNFTQEELYRIERVSKSIRNRMLDYRKLSSYDDIAALEGLFDYYASNSSVGSLLLNDAHRVIFYNGIAAELCSKLFADGKTDSPDYFVQRMADRATIYCIPRYNVFELEFPDSKPVYCTCTPCFLPGKLGVSLAYLMQFSTDKCAIVSKGSASENVLTRRQIEIVHFIADGMSNKEIADQLFISEGTVKKHVENIRELLGVNSRIGILKKMNMI